jgi:preprotein translocase subunit SecD
MKRILPLLAACLLSLAATPTIVFTPPALQFRLVVDSPTADSEQMTVVQQNNSSRQPEVLNVQKEVLLDNSVVKSATVVVDSGGNPEIDVKLTDDGAKRLAEVTRQNIGKRLALVVDGKLYEAPRIATAITGGEALITGHFTKEEAENLATRINGSPASEKPPVMLFVIRATPLLLLVMVGVLGVSVWMLMRRKATPPAP